MERIAVVGTSGSGKTTLARALSDKLGLAHIELDGIFHQPNWVPRPSDEFQAELQDRMVASGDRWVTCGNYSSVSGDLHLRQADTVVWLDMSRPVIMRRVIARTVRRAITREELWNGNREPLTNFYNWDPEVNIIRWAWTRFESTRSKYEEKAIDGSWSHATIIRLRTPAEVAAFLDAAE